MVALGNVGYAERVNPFDRRRITGLGVSLHARPLMPRILVRKTSRCHLGVDLVRNLRGLLGVPDPVPGQPQGIAPTSAGDKLVRESDVGFSTAPRA